MLTLIKIEYLPDLNTHVYYYSDGAIVSNCGEVWNYGNGVFIVNDDHIECEEQVS